ncbi:MAG: 16S rRNA (cytosine(1402)-N(4))-methyltransferase RsmH [Flavobacteriales bacterium]|nr:16S rRNA (cytosine(1402)-N(4))-methyltransferase RsmH [Flavobacteriales bacterium]NDA97706.1 16S rRNA (cytosine(1402)-N(4))-methyltransferase RsmH [Flavobacteriia bacterium]NDC27850.1 16S rRNA (cytosine(1402)-N(4))-methyltransferase RsmH [Crocinitomicaceae bacterium]NDC92113.1 16S rRNA (cytosine(1402)-N(4))-methyltransferase RsmH [Flavobacteriales bacterium]
MDKKIPYHIPVLLQECIQGLEIKPEGVYVDVTFGGGGHAKEIFKQINEQGKLIVFDQDAAAKENTWKAPNFYFVPSNFIYLSNHLKAHKFDAIDGLLADLGVSSHQFDLPERGFSIREDAPLDMRMNQNSERSAFEVVNLDSEDKLISIFRYYGELSNSRALAGEIIRQRASKSIKTTFELMAVLKPFAPKFKDHKFYAQVFQAIRIEVNQELDALKQLLLQSSELLKPGGRLVVISYHSLEDRLVKNFMKRGSFEGEIQKDFFGNVLKPFKELIKHPLVPDEDEIRLNSRARSAKLRIAEKND